MQMADSRPRSLPALTGLRFVAAALVVLEHSTPFGLRPTQREPFDFRQAVSFFFVLSGFILTHVYPELRGWGQRGRFLLARFARLWPAYAVTFLLFLLWLGSAPAAAGRPAWLTTTLNLSMLQAWAPSGQLDASWHVVAWSVSVEFAFYLFFTALWPGWRRRWPALLALALAVTVSVIVGCRLTLPPHRAPGDPWLAEIILVQHPLIRLFEFVLGMAAAVLWRRLEPRLKLGRLGGTLLEAAALALAVLAMGSSPALSRDVCLLSPGLGLYASLWIQSAGVVCVPFALLIAALACGRGWLSRLLESKPLVLLGEISFAVYMLHPLLLAWFQQHAAAFDEVPRRWTYPAFWLLLLLGSHLLWAAVERPARVLLVGLWPKPGETGRVGAQAGRSLWDRLAAPGRRWLLGEALLLAALLAPVLYLSARPTGRFVGPDDAFAVARAGSPEARDAHFGPGLVLRGAELKRTHSLDLRVKLVWQPLGEPPPGALVRVQLLDREGAVRYQCDRPLGDGRLLRPGKALWQQKELAPVWAVEDAEALAVSVFGPTAVLLPPDRGPRCFCGCALRLPLPR
jgi:peptidoglycan/LPS O-acetylase OafA/YrhL